MKADFDCMPCVLTQALTTARQVTDDPLAIARIMEAAHELSRSLDCAQTPATICNPIYRMVEEITGHTDPYAAAKRKYNDLALTIYPDALKMLDNCGDRLHGALKLAVAGNIIDLGIALKFDLRQVVAEVLQAGFAVDDYALFRQELASARSLLLLGDNAGEIVFDRILLEELLPLGLELCYAVKSGPIINDSTMEDALYTGIDGVCRVIVSGSNCIGTPLDRVSTEFREVFDNADIVIGKGHGHYETLAAAAPRPVYSLLRAKCRLVANSLGIRQGEVAFKLVEAAF